MRFWSSLFLILFFASVVSHADDVDCGLRNEFDHNNGIILMKQICDQNLAEKKIDCSSVPKENEHKKLCDYSQFDKSRITDPDKKANCGLSFKKAALSPYVELKDAVDQTVDYVWNCYAKNKCGSSITDREKREIEEMQQEEAVSLKTQELKEEEQLCQQQAGTRLGCAIPQISCRDWRVITNGQVLKIDGKVYRPSDFSDKEGAAKSAFCRKAASTLAATRSKKLYEKKREIDESVELALRAAYAEYFDRFKCYRDEYIWDEICKGLGTGASVFGPGILLKAIQMLAEGVSKVQVIAWLQSQIKKPTPLGKQPSKVAADSKFSFPAGHPVHTFPELKKQYETSISRMNSWKSDRPIASLEDLDDWRFDPRSGYMKNYGKFDKRDLPKDPDVSKALVESRNMLNAKEETVPIMRQIFSEAALETKKDGIGERLLARGKVSEKALEKTLVQYFKKEGIEVQEVYSASVEEFQMALSKGPVVDFSNEKADHGRLPHLIQLRLVYEKWKKATNGSPEKVFQYLGTPEGGKVWLNIFDSYKVDKFMPPGSIDPTDLFGSPEDLTSLLTWVERGK